VPRASAGSLGHASSQSFAPGRRKSKLAYSLKREMGECPAKTGEEGEVERAHGGAPHALGAEKSLVLSHFTSEGRLERESDWNKLIQQVGA